MADQILADVPSTRSMSQTVLIDAFYTAGIDGHGGDHRTSQILELLAHAKLTPSIVAKPTFTTQRDRYMAGIRSMLNSKALQFIAQHPRHSIASPASIVHFGFQNQIYGQALRQHQGSKLLLWETTKHFAAPNIAREKGFNVIALPHNLDCFVLPPEQFQQNFSIEIEALRAAHAVFCISREEQWLLKLRGIHADYLPYYPCKSILARLLEIRQSRTNSRKKNLLILGSAGNIPTFQGMVEQIQWLRSIRNDQEFQVDIVGYRTESLQPYCEHDDFVVHGSATPEELKNFMTHATVALVHQRAAAGVLTRIPELLIAGIPVIANSTACRSAFGFSGVHCYDTEAELAALLTEAFEMPEVLPRPIAAEQRFIDQALQLI